MIYALSLPSLPVELIELVFEVITIIHISSILHFATANRLQGLSKPDILSLRLTSHTVSCIATRVMFPLLVQEIFHEHKTYLHTAISSHRHVLVSSLLGSGAPPEALGINKCTPLHTAARIDCMFSLRLLLQRGADVDAEDKFGWTALQLAARFGHGDFVSVLIANGADVDKEGFQGWTACYYAHREGHAKVESLLRHNGAKVIGTKAAGENSRTQRRTGWGQWSPLWR
jgi:hypothetical protein